MISDLNIDVKTGRLVQDPIVKEKLVLFSIAVNYKWGQKEETYFFDCKAWKPLGDLIAQYAKKGDSITLSGRLEQYSYENKEGEKRTGVCIVVENFIMGQRKKQDDIPF